MQYIRLPLRTAYEEITFQTRTAARDRWCNISTFAAILTIYSSQNLLPKSVDFAWCGRQDIAIALESPLIATDEFTSQDARPYFDIRMEESPSLWLPAAIMWIVIAGKEMFESSGEGNTKARPLYVEARRTSRKTQRKAGVVRDERPSEEFSLERWKFWSKRLREIAEADVLSLEMTGKCDEAARDYTTQ